MIIYSVFITNSIYNNYSSIFTIRPVFGSLTNVPEGEDPNNYIDKRTDWNLRKKAIDANSDICNEYLIKKYFRNNENSLLTLKISLPELKKISNSYKKHYEKCPESLVVARIEPCFVTKGYLHRILKKNCWLCDEVVNFVFQCFNLCSHYFATAIGCKPDFFVDGHFYTLLNGEDLKSYNFFI